MTNYLILAAIAILVIFTFGRRILIMINPKVKNVSAEEAKKIISENKDIVILDVRTSGEYKSGHIPGAILMPSQEISSRVSELSKYADKPVLVYCASGGRSPGAVNVLLNNNFEKVYHLSRGISSWSYGVQR